MIPLIKRYQLEMVILGGNISLAFDAFSPAMKTALEADQITAAIRITTLQENAALIGAASCLEAQVKINSFELP